MKHTTLTIQSFGRENEYRRAVLTIWSYYAHTGLDWKQTKVCLFTDRPEWFHQYLQGLPVEYVLLTPEKIKTMRGKIDFLHRMKIALIEETFSRTEGNILYADSDTFFTSDPTLLEQELSPEQSFMHLREYPFSDMKDMPLPMGETFQAFYRLITSRTLKGATGQPVKISPESASWNAGVMFFHPSHVRLIPDVYALTDQFYPETQNHASEQYAFSVLLQNNTALHPCDSVIYHYWYRVKKQIADELLQSVFTEQWSLMPVEQKQMAVKEMTRTLPAYFESHMLAAKDDAIQAFNANQFSKGYRSAFRALRIGALRDTTFIKDILYHFKRQLKGAK